MKASQFPKKMAIPFGINGPRQDLQAAEIDGSPLASYSDGFPPITMLDKTEGGLPPQGKDFNQILYELSSTGQWSAAGSFYPYDAVFSAAISGYPKGAIVLGGDNLTLYQSQFDDNTTAPGDTNSKWETLAEALGISDAAIKSVFAGENGAALIGTSGGSNVQAEISAAENEIGTKLTSSLLSSNDGFKYIGLVPNYATLKTITPSVAGQKIQLYSHSSESSDTPKGGGMFTAVAIPSGTTVTDDGGTIATVNESWLWRRVFDGPYTVEMFGARGDGVTDDAPAIRQAYASTAGIGAKALDGDGVYLLASPIYLYPAVSQPQIPGQYSIPGFNFSLNVIRIDASSWPALPDEWWNAQAAFMFAANYDVEGLTLWVNSFDGGGVATFMNTFGAAINTSTIYVGLANNHIGVIKDYLGQIFNSGTENKILGKSWQRGYFGILHGGTGNGLGNGETMYVDVSWLSEHRYGGVLLQDRTQYNKVAAGTYDFNGQWASLLTLTNYTDTEPYSIEFGDVITNGTLSSYALSSIMNFDGAIVLLVTESANKRNGTSDYTAGDTITCGSWSATVESALVTHDNSNGQTPNYFDIIVSNRTGDFSKCTLTPDYVGGMIGHNFFDNYALSPNSYDVAKCMSWRGMAWAGGQTVQQEFVRHLYGDTPVKEYYEDHVNYYKSLELGNNTLYGLKNAVTAIIGTPVTLFTFPAAADETTAFYYTVNVGSSDSTQYAFNVIIRCGVSTMNIVINPLSQFLTLSVSGFSLMVEAIGSPAVISATAIKNLN